MDVHNISPCVFTKAILKDVDVVLASPPMLARHLPKAHRGRAPPEQGATHRLANLIKYLEETQPVGFGFI